MTFEKTAVLDVRVFEVGCRIDFMDSRATESEGETWSFVKSAKLVN